MRLFFGLIALLILSLSTLAQEPLIVSHATGNDTTIVIIQPEGLSNRLHYREETDEPKAEKEEFSEEVKETAPREGKIQKGIGYRVQVFSDNNPRTAKNEARNRQRTVSGRFPRYRAYVSYSAPYWRTRVGDFRSEGQANSAAAEMRRAFPKFSKEIRVVRDRVSMEY